MDCFSHCDRSRDCQPAAEECAKSGGCWPRRLLCSGPPCIGSSFPISGASSATRGQNQTILPRVKKFASAASRYSRNYTRTNTSASLSLAIVSVAILAYDLISYFWSFRQESHTVEQGTQEFAALCELEETSAELSDQPPGPADQKLVNRFLKTQQALSHLLRLRPKPAEGKSDTRWLITDLVTLGSPLTHAEFLLANSTEDLGKRKTGREFPTSPPVREDLDDSLLQQAQAAGLPVKPERPQLFSFALGPDGRYWQLHHGAPYAVVRWTNIFDPARNIFRGDIISGPLAPVFGPGIVDIDLREVRGQSQGFTHTKYWDLENSAETVPPHIIELRKALNLAGQCREV